MRSFLGILTATAIVAPIFGISADSMPASAYPKIVGQAGVTDGDTIRFGMAKVTAEGKTIEMTGVRVRLHGIDAPEKGQICKDAKNKDWFCGNDAVMAMTAIVRTEEVTCFVHDIDHYKRLVAVCSVAGIPDINAEMVKRGLAVAYQEYSTDYVDEEEAARSSRIGMWTGKFDMPWDWRKAH